MFLNNEYTFEYWDIIGSAKKREYENNTPLYFEKHHIIPKSIEIGLEKCPDNIVKLSLEEHFIVHSILPYCLSIKKDRDKMLFLVKKT